MLFFKTGVIVLVDVTHIVHKNLLGMTVLHIFGVVLCIYGSRMVYMD